jgi:hypothetical protein
MDCPECARLNAELKRAENHHASLTGKLKSLRGVVGQDAYMHLRSLEHDARTGLHIADTQMQRHRAVCRSA